MSRLMQSSLLRRLVGLSALALLGPVLSLLPAAAQTSCAVTVTSLADSGAGTLRNAIAVAAASGATTICFQSGLQGTIALQSTLTISNVVDITGPGASAVTISGAGNDSVPALQPIVINLNNTASTPVTLQGFTISGGSAKIGGGVWVSGGYVRLFQDIVTGNTAEAGGGIYNQGYLTVQNTSVDNNSATNGLGGGIFNIAGGTLTLTTDSVFSNTSNTNGGGIANNGTMTLEGTTMYSNSGAGGGAIYNDGLFNTVGTESSLTNNSASLAGGGFYNDTGATASMTDMWMDSNAASGSGGLGGAIYNAGTLTVSESTFSANTTTDFGGAIYNLGGLTLTDSTLSTNIAAFGGGALDNDTTSSTASLTLHNDILSGNTTNTSGNTVTDCLGCGTPSSDNLIGVPVNLGPLSFNGGINRTFMPLPGSAAIGGGVYSIGGVVVVPDSTDQRGLSRITVNGNSISVDVGAVQTHYSSVNFVNQPASTGVDQTLAAVGGGAIFATVEEVDGETTNFPEGVPVTVSLGTTNSVAPATLSGTLTEYPNPGSNGIEASFADLSVNVDGKYYLTATTYPNEPGGQLGTYTASSGNFTISGTGPTPALSWTPATLSYGTGIPQSELDATATVNGQPAQGTFAYNFVASGQPINVGQVYAAGAYTVEVLFTSVNGGTTGLQTTLTIAQATPTVTVVTPPTLLPGTALSTANVHGMAVNAAGVAVPGTFAYTPALGTVPAAGSQTVKAVFTPTDSTDYMTVNGSATFTVLAQSATNTAFSVSPASAYPGTAETFAATVTPGSGIAGVVGGVVGIVGVAPSSQVSLGNTPALALQPGANFSVSSAQTGFALTTGSPSSQSADMNGDGVADQVVINGTTVNVLLADPANPGTYAKAVTLTLYSACYYVSGIAIGDVNGDGLNDLIVACENHPSEPNGGGPIVVYLNQGNGGFAAAVATGGQGSSPMQGAVVALGDSDGDGKLDLISISGSCANGGSACIAFQHGNGDGTFNAATYTLIEGGTPSTYSTANFASLQAVDFNQDGRADLSFLFLNVDGDQTLEVWVASGSSAVTFGNYVGGQDCSPGPCYDPNASVNPTPGNYASQLVAADMNGDGVPDLVAVTSFSDGGDGSTNTVSVALNSVSAGTISFPATTTDTVVSGAQSIGVADFNQDGLGDVAVYSGNTSLLSILTGKGDGTFSNALPSATITLNPASNGEETLYPVFSVGDANGDGYPDIHFVLPTLNGTASAQIGILNGATAAQLAGSAPNRTTNYTGTTTPASKLWAGSSGSQTVTVEQNVVSLNWPVGVLTYGTPMPASELDATATLNGQPATGTFAYTFTSGALSGQTITVGQVYPAGTYNVQVVFTPSGSTANYSLAEILTIEQATVSLAAVTPGTLLPGAKVTTANVHAVASGLGGALLAGTFSYTPALGTTLAAGEQPVTVSFTPADTVDYAAPSPVSVQVNVAAASPISVSAALSPNPATPGQTVGLSVEVAPGVGSGITGAVPGSVAFGSPGGGSVTLPLTMDQDAFTAENTQSFALPSNAGTYTTYSADVNGDGVADEIIVAGGEIGIVLSTVGGPSLSAPITVNLAENCAYAVAVAIGDVNGDGLPDIAAACNNFDSTSTSLVVLVNQGAGNFSLTTPVTITNTEEAQMVLGDFNGDGKADLVMQTVCLTGDTAAPCLTFMPGDGTGGFGAGTSELIYNAGYADTFANLLTADFDKDGKLDISFLHYTTANPAGVIEVWRNDGGASPLFGSPNYEVPCSGNCYSPSATITAGSGGTLASLISADFNNDGLPDLALVTSVNPYGLTNTRSVVLNTTSGGTLSFPAAATDVETSGTLGSAVVAGDFNKDGVVDLAYYNGSANTVSVLLGAGDGTFAFSEPNFVITLNPPVVPDVRRPGGTRPDARGNGRGLRPDGSYVNGAYYPLLAVGDVNGDGYPDLLIGQYTQNSAAAATVQQFVTSGETIAATKVVAPATGGTYTAAVTPSAPVWKTGSASTNLAVEALTTSTTLTLSQAAPVYGTAITLTAKVVNTATGLAASGGTVTFSQDGAAVGSPVALDTSGSATVGGITPTAGSHTFGASYSGSTTEAASTATNDTVTVAKYTPTLVWPTPAAITTTTPLSGAQLDATAEGLPGSTLALAGTYVYSPAAGTLLSAGTHTLSVTFTPNDATDFAIVSKTVTIQVNETNTRTSLSVSPASPTYGQTLTLSALVVNTSGSSVVQGGTVTFTSDSTTLQSVSVVNGAASLSGVSLGAGTHVLNATYSGTASEGASSQGQTIQVAQAAPVLSWATPAAITTTTPLGAAQLDATAAGVTGASLAGSFAYTPAAGTVLTAGTHTLSVTFTPTDATDYSTATATVQIQVNATNTQTVVNVSPAQPVYGQTITLTAQVTNATGSTVVGSGSVVFTADNATLQTVSVVNGLATLSGVSLGGGQHVITAAYTGAAGEGASVSAVRTVTVAKATPVINWATPESIAATTPLSATQLNASAAGVSGAALPGSYVYSPAAGTLLTVGAHTLGVTFTPTDATDYAVATGQVTIQVVAETITLSSITPATTELSTTPLPVVLTGSGFPSSSVVQMNGTTLATTVISATQLGATIPAASVEKAGSLSFTIYDAASQAISNALTVTVTAPTPTATVTVPATITSAEQSNVAVALTKTYPVDIAGTFNLTFTPSGSDGVDDPAVQFSTGGRTYNFTIPAGSTTGPTASLQSGTVEGTISIATQLTAGGVNVTPPDLDTPAAISVPPSAPTITSVTFTNVNGLMTVVVTGFSNTREMVDGVFIFTGPGSTSLASSGVTVPAAALFGTWYTSPASAAFGSTFVYTQTFQLSDDTTQITGVGVTMTNTVGSSASVNSQ